MLHKVTAVCGRDVCKKCIQ